MPELIGTIFKTKERKRYFNYLFMILAMLEINYYTKG